MKKAWIAVVLGALLVGTLVGVVWARPNNRPSTAEPTRKITLAGADFIPTQDDWDYADVAQYITCDSGTCNFTAPIDFPTLGAVTVERIKLHVDDDNNPGFAYARLHRLSPSTGAAGDWGMASSPIGVSGGLQTFTGADTNRVVWPSQRAFIWLYIGSPDIDVYGVTVEYHRNV